MTNCTKGSNEKGRLATLNGGSEVAFGYNEQGQLLWDRNAEGKREYAVATTANGTALTERSTGDGAPIREWAYDRNSHIGRLDKGLNEANENGWTVIDIEKDWKVVYPYELDK